MIDGETGAPVHVEIGGWLQTAWEYFVEDAVPWCIIGLIYVAAFGVLGNIPVAGQIALLVLNGPLVGGMFYAAFARMRGTPVTVGMLFAPMQTDFPQLALVGLVSGVLGALAALLTCGLGVFVVFPLWMFAIPLVLERKQPFWDALETSRKTVQAQLSQWILYGVVCLLIMAAGSLALGLGLIVTIPVGVLMVAVAYREVFGLQSAGHRPVRPPAPPPDMPGSPSAES